MSDVTLEVITGQTSDLHAVIIEGVTFVYWLDLYQAIGLQSKHAGDVISRLTEGIHYKRFNRSEIKEILDGITVTVTLPAVRTYYFLSAEGWNRAILEITESRLNNPEVAAHISDLKGKMANIYTRYQSGEVLSKAADEIPSLPGEAYVPVAVVLEDQMAIARIMIGEGVEPAIAKAVAISVTEDITHCGDTLTPWRNLIQADPLMAEPALLTATDIGKSIGGMSAVTVNKVLQKLGYQIKQGKEWVPTYTGKLYARFVPQEIKHNRGIIRHMQLKWLPSIVEKLRQGMFYEQRGQTGLFSGECGS